MEGKKKTEINESQIQDNIYILKIRYIALILGSICLIFLGFFFNYPVEDRVKSIIISKIKKNRSCRLEYSEFNLSLFLRPHFNFKDLIVPGRCFGNARSLISFEDVDLLVKRPTVIPLGLLIEATAKSGITQLKALVTTGMTSPTIRIEKSTLEAAMIPIIANLPIKLKGSLSIDGIFSMDYTNMQVPTSAEIHIVSNDLNLPPQRIIILDIKGISLAPTIFKATIKDQILTIHRLQLGNSTTKIEVIFTDATIKLNKKNIMRSSADLVGKIRLSKEFLEEFAIIGGFLMNAKLDGNGFYRIQLKGPLGSLRPKLL